MQAICGVYALTLVHTTGQYIGSSVDIMPRFTRHQSMLRQGIHPNKALQEDWSQLSDASCILHVLERNDDQVSLEAAEDRWINALAPIYNAGRRARRLRAALPRQMGIYAITHIATGRRYIGMSMKIHHRLGQHRAALRHNKSGHRDLQKAWLEFGEDAFAFEILEVVGHDYDLEVTEQKWLDDTLLLFNRSSLAGRPRGYKHDEESRRHMSQGQQGQMTAQRRTQLSLWARTRSQETLQKMREAANTRWADQEQRDLVSKALKAWHTTPEGHAQHSESQTKRWSKQEERDKQSERKRDKKQCKQTIARRGVSLRGKRGQPMKTNKSSGIRGISWATREQRWTVILHHDKHVAYRGYFKTLEEAKAALELHRFD